MFSFTRTIVGQLLKLLYAERLTTGILSVLVKPVVYGEHFLGLSKTKSGRKRKLGARAIGFETKRLSHILYESLVDTLNAVFWIALVLIIADVMFGNAVVFTFMDNNRWLGFLLVAFVVFRFLVRRERR